jgi:hypothetical protein
MLPCLEKASGLVNFLKDGEDQLDMEGDYDHQGRT